MKWFRLWSDIANNPKVQRLPAPLFKAWINLLCLANQGQPRGSLPGRIEDIAFGLRIKPSAAATIIDRLIEKRLLDLGGDRRYHVHNWTRWQRESDDVATRVSQHRARKDSDDVGPENEGNVTASLPETLLKRPQKRTEQNREEKKRTDTPPDGGRAPALAVSDDFITFWEIYPSKMNRAAAHRAWQARLKDGVSPGDLVEAARRYASHCRRQQVASRYIMHARTFLGPGGPWSEWRESDPEPVDDGGRRSRFAGLARDAGTGEYTDPGPVYRDLSEYARRLDRGICDDP